MSLTISAELIDATTSPKFAKMREDKGTRFRDREIEIETEQLDSDTIEDLAQAARTVNDNATVRVLDAVRNARSGVFDKPVPSFRAFKAMLEEFLKADAIDGWIYVTGADGKLYPYLVTSVQAKDGRNEAPSVVIHAMAYTLTRDGRTGVGIGHRTFSFAGKDVSNRRLADIFAAKGIYKETAQLRADHEKAIERHHSVTRGAFAQQFRFQGQIYQHDDRHSGSDGEIMRAKVVHDLEATDYRANKHFGETFIFPVTEDDGGVGPVPEHPLVRVFDLRTHGFYWVNGEFLVPYQYDKTLGSKLILPKTHRDLLNVLTSDLDLFVNDVIEGKSAGNVILCKGPPGVGKTLTAEVYAELTGRPLYSIHSGSLGTKSSDIEKNLKEIFKRSKRWNPVLLLDEADVFVVERGGNIEQNAIVAEFLRVLEYFDGLLFMTTNRPKDIDDAIISRCAAIIEYAPPSPEDAAAIWAVQATQYETVLGDELTAQLVALFPEITARDIKMLLRLVLRVSRAAGKAPSIDVFRQCAMFRAIKMADQSDALAAAA